MFITKYVHSDESILWSSKFEKNQLLNFEFQDDDLTQHLLTASLENWSRKTCLSLAIVSRNLKFLAHPISQAILADLWMGGLRMRKNPVFKIIIGLFFPPSIVKLVRTTFTDFPQISLQKY